LENTAPEKNSVYQAILDQADIVAVIAFFLGQQALVRKGKVYLAICPFHADTHPSMRIDPTRKIFKCFVCGTGGNAISFVQKYAKLSLLESERKVCEICQLPLLDKLSSRSSFEETLTHQYPKELAALEDLRKFYQLTLQSNDGSDGAAYLNGRKIPADIITQFGIGFAPQDSTQSITALRKIGYDVDVLERAGILASSRAMKDNYSSRIMFPIQDNYGHTVAFSGRLIHKDPNVGKYVNYPETVLFHKNEVLYHFSEASATARKDGFIYLMEGFMDVIATVRAGISSVVGTMGTALTAEHLKALKGLHVEVRLCLDSDGPGQQAMMKAVHMFVAEKIPCRVTRVFKGGKDADEILTNLGKEALVLQLNRLFDPFLFLLSKALTPSHLLLDTKAIQDFITQSADVFLSLSPLDQEKDLVSFSEVTTLPKETLRKSLLDTHVPVLTKQDLAQKYNVAKRIARPTLLGVNDPNSKPFIALPKNLKDEAMMLEAGKEIYLTNLIAKEIDLLLVLPSSRLALTEFQNSKDSFVFRPCYDFAMVIQTIYLDEPTLKTFGEREYEVLLKTLVSPNDSVGEAKAPLDSDIDFSGLDDSGESLPVLPLFHPELSEFYNHIIATCQNFQETDGGKNLDSFRKNLSLHKPWAECNAFLANAKLKSDGVLSKEDTITYYRLMRRCLKLTEKTDVDRSKVNLRVWEPTEK
jgi:DNA primase catalytic core